MENKRREFSVKNDTCFWYKKPANKFWDGLPMGTGRFFGMLHGSETQQILTFNDETFWTGSPYNPTATKNPAITNKVKDLIAENKLKEADEYSKKMIGVPNNVQNYQALSALKIEILGIKMVNDYIRCLDMENALITTQFSSDQVFFQTETFASFPNQLIVHKISNDTNNVQINLRFDCLHAEKVIQFYEDEYIIDCKPSKIVDRGLFGQKTEMENVLRARLAIKIRGENIHISQADDGMNISGNEIILYCAGATNYVSHKDFSADEKSRVKEYLNGISDYERIKNAHLSDYKTLFNTVELKMGKANNHLDTTTRLKRLKFGITDLHFMAQYFQFSRYITICGAREGTLAFNNHNPWLDDLKGKWQGRWTLNINLQACYWYIDSAGLSPLFDSLLTFIEGLSKTGRITARELYGADGWVCHHGTDVWLNSAPTDYEACHAIYPVANAWLCYHLFEHYKYTLNKEYLSRVLPIMEGAASFLRSLLIEKDGYLITSISSSPENQFFHNGRRVALSMGDYHDTELIRSLLLNINKARNILGIEPDISLETILKKLPPYKVNRRGGLNEWYEDYLEGEIHHRHLSHLFAVYPDNDISLDKTPLFAKAALKTILLRGKYSTGWSGAWRINLFARLKQPLWAFKQLKKMVRSVSIHPSRSDSSVTPSYEGNQAIQGIGAGIIEMLMQSDGETIKILPAIDEKMGNGYIKGIVAKGGYFVDIEWKKGQLKQAKIIAKHDGIQKIEVNAKKEEKIFKKGEIYIIKGEKLCN